MFDDAPVLSTSIGELPLDEVELSVGDRVWSILHTGALIDREQEVGFLRTETQTRQPYGIALWPSAIALAHALAIREVRGKRILELGAGTGLPGIVAAALGARVVQTDRAIAGWIVVFPTWLAFLILHDQSPWLFLSFAFIVWVADVFAYFVGKAIGKQKLAPSISPGKTVQGALGGMAGVALYFFVWKMLAEQSVSRGETWANQLLSHGLWVLGFFVLLGVLSVIGDLFESWMKRGAGMKDSSGLLPGHGGFLDRIDALTSTLPIAGLYILLTAAK